MRRLIRGGSSRALGGVPLLQRTSDLHDCGKEVSEHTVLSDFPPFLEGTCLGIQSLFAPG